MRATYLAWLCAANLVAASAPVLAQSPAPHSRTIEPRLLSALVWRNVGPFRGGRISAVSGVIGQPGVFYMGTPAGGVWKTTSAGETWYPIFDSIKTVSSIGAVEVAPSDPNLIYVGTGDMRTAGTINEGDGMYKSSDAGHTWQRIGLENTKHIPSILVDPRDARVVLVAARGNVYAKSDARGAFRTTDGGATWTKTLFVNQQIGVEKLARAYDAPDVVFAATVFYNAAPGARRPTAPPDTALTRTRLYKSTDAGVTWREISGGGLPRLDGRLSIAVAMGTNAQRVYLIGNFGLYRSDDGGVSWRRMAANDKRIANAQGGYNCGVYVDPKNPDVVYTFHTSAYKSTDGGNTFTGFRGAPGGDDPQQMWIDPTDGKRLIMGFDQGAIISLDGGASFSSWYNQSVEQIYHISTDNSFPYWIYATQQDAGAVATRSRGNLGAITALDWKPVPGWEWGTILPDPRDPNVVYSTGLGVSRITYPGEEFIGVGPGLDPALELRSFLSQPIVWADWNGRHELLAGYQYLMATADGGAHWTKLGPDLSIPHPTGPVLAGGPTLKRDTAKSPAPPFASIESISPSPVAAGIIWIGTNNGIIQVTRDHGRSWNDVSIPGVEAGTRPIVVSIEASPHDAATAYATVAANFRGDYAPYVYRTRDFGRTWTKIVTGLPAALPSGAFAGVIRADPVRRGLLFVGTESALYISFDDGDHWQSLMVNLPNTSYRDIVIHENDLIVATYGRGIWILDDIAPLRQLSPAIAVEPAHLFKPSDATRVRRNVNYNTPLPIDVPQALNPPAGAIVYYSLGAEPSGRITLEVLDATGAVVRHLSSVAAAAVKEADKPNFPSFWVQRPTALSADIGLNRAVWDLRYDAPPAFAHTFEINGNPGMTPPSPEGPMVLPGVYTVRLTVDGKRYMQTVTVRPDPRSRVPAADLVAQHALLMRAYSGLEATWNDFKPVTDLRDRIAKLAAADSTSAAGKAAGALAAKLDSIVGDTTAEPRMAWNGGKPDADLVSLNREFALELNAQDNADHAPTQATLAATRTACNELRATVDKWKKLVDGNAATLNLLLGRGATVALAPPASSQTCSEP